MNILYIFLFGIIGSFLTSDSNSSTSGQALLGSSSIIKNINFSIKKIHSSIFHFLPILKFHEIILIKTDNKELYTLDFTPIHQKETSTLFNLFIGNNVNANIRIRNINISKNEINDKINEIKIIELWNNMNDISEKESEILSKKTLNKIKNKSLKLFIKNSIIKWPNKMNLYKCNCIHYGNYVYRNYLDI